MEKPRKDVNVTADSVITGIHAQYSGLIKRLVQENALLTASNETQSDRAAELEQEIAALRDLLEPQKSE